MLLEQSTYRLKIPDEIAQQAWHSSQTIALRGLRLQSYSNQVCLDTLLPWLDERFADTQVAVEGPALNPSQWELVSGFSLNLQRANHPPLKLVCLPGETMDRSEFRVPQEWVDVPSWAGDYYLAIEVDPDEQWIELWGYATHAQLKTTGEFDSCDRTYRLDSTELITDLSVLWVMLQIGTEPARSPLPALPPLSTERCEAWIDHLRQSGSPLSHLQIPFAEWGALLEQVEVSELVGQPNPPEVAESLTVPTSPSPMTRLGQWFNNVVETGWQTLEEIFGTGSELALELRGETGIAEQRRAKAINLGGNHPPLWLFVRLEPEANDRYTIRIRLLPMETGAFLPPSTCLTLYSVEGNLVQSVEARQQDTSIQLKRFRCPPGTAFDVEVAIAEATVTESFLT